MAKIENLQRKELLGKGGVAEVYDGIMVDPETEEITEVAVKQYKTENKKWKSYKKRESRFFADLEAYEKKVGKKMAHLPHLIAEGEDCLVLEKIKFTHQNLEFDLRNQQFKFEKKLDLILQAIAALQEYYLVSKDVPHLDVKVRNFILSSQEVLFLTDFDGYKIQEENTDTVFGTTEVMAPEQWYPGQSTLKTDIFSLGILIYRILTNGKKLPLDFPDMLSPDGKYKYLSLDDMDLLAQSSVGLVELINAKLKSCLLLDPNSRPDLNDLEKFFADIQRRIKK